MYADGNAMGKLIKQIENADQFKFFSNTVDQSIRNACHEALYETFVQNQNDKLKIMPADILLLGGDDLMVYLTAESAFPFAIKIAQKFNEMTQQKFSSEKGSFFNNVLKGRGLTISTGIAYGKSHTPFSILLNQAEELLASAKKGGVKDERSDNFFSHSYIDFHFSTYFNQINVADSRKNHLELPGAKPIKLYQKPYSLDDAEVLYEHANNLVQIGIPKTRLRRFGYAPTLGKPNGTLECLKLYTRTRKKEHKLAIWNTLSHFDCIRHNNDRGSR